MSNEQKLKNSIDLMLKLGVLDESDIDTPESTPLSHDVINMLDKLTTVIERSPEAKVAIQNVVHNDFFK